MRLVTCHFPEWILEVLDDLVALKVYPNRSEAIRTAVRDLIKEDITLLDLNNLAKKYKDEIHEEIE